MTSRSDIKAIFDYLVARLINAQQAAQQLTTLGFNNPQPIVAKFLAGDFSYNDVFTKLGV